MNRIVVFGAALLVCGCTASGPKGDQGPVGPPGPQGSMGTAGQVVVLAAADGGLLIVDGGVVLASGPPGPPGSVVVVSTIDGGAISIDGGIVIVSGPAGPQGVQGTPGQSVIGSSEPAGTNCATGGVRLVSSGGSAFVCNGAQGAAGQSVGFAVEPPGTTCPTGGVRLIAAVGTSVVCNGTTGIQGQQGVQGVPGQALFVFAADGGTAILDGGVVLVAGPRGAQGPPGPPGLSPRLIFVEDTSSTFADGGRHPLLSLVYSIPPNSSVAAPVVQSFVLPIESPTTTVIRMEGRALASNCQNDTSAPRWNGDLTLFISLPDGGSPVPAGGVLRCDRRAVSGAGNPCDDGFVFTTTIPSGALATGEYRAAFVLGQSCTTTLWAGSADYFVGEAVTLVTQYP